MTHWNERTESFCRRFGLSIPVLLAPMAGSCPPPLSIAIANTGGCGACGALLMSPTEILDWVQEFRKNSQGPFQINIWIPSSSPHRDAEQESKVRSFLENWAPVAQDTSGDQTSPNFEAQIEAMLEAHPPILSSIMGLFPPELVKRIKSSGIAWFATATTVQEAIEAEAAGADVIIAQGSEAGGHRGAFQPSEAEKTMVGLISLVPCIVDSVRVPVVAAGGIADERGVAAALMLGASAVQIGTGFLRCPEAKTHPAWANALGQTQPENTRVSRVFSGKAGRSIATHYVHAATAPSAPEPAPYPIQRRLTAAMRAEAAKLGDVHRMQAWAGQSASLSKALPAAQVLEQIWTGTKAILGFE